MSNYHQEKLIELLKKVHPMGGIGQVMLDTVKAVLPQNEKIIACYYQLDFSENMEVGGGPQFYSSLVQVLTPLHFIDLGFFPKYHSQRIVAVGVVADVRLENTFVTGFEGGDEAVTAESTGFKPLITKVEATLTDPRGDKLEPWVIEATRAEQVENCAEVGRTLLRLVGKPLAEAAG